VIIPQDTEVAEYMLRKLAEEYMKWVLEIKFGKTQYLTLYPGAGIMTERGQIQIPGIHSGSHRCNHLRNREKNKQWKKSDWHVKLCLVEQNYPSQNPKKLSVRL
jgi:hypothetical protein